MLQLDGSFRSRSHMGESVSFLGASTSTPFGCNTGELSLQSLYHRLFHITVLSADESFVLREWFSTFFRIRGFAKLKKIQIKNGYTSPHPPAPIQFFLETPHWYVQNIQFTIHYKLCFQLGDLTLWLPAVFGDEPVPGQRFLLKVA